jgi:outer membrane lipoprotein
LFIIAMVGCASPPIKVDNVVVEKTPHAVSVSAVEVSGNVVWGGVIVSAHNLSDRTQLEVLSYPLSKNQRPRTDREPTGRFLIQSKGYLELASYKQGRVVTVLGTLQGVTQGAIGEAEYRYPTVTASDVHLWEERSQTQSGVIFGIGISIGG